MGYSVHECHVGQTVSIGLIIQLREIGSWLSMLFVRWGSLSLYSGQGEEIPFIDLFYRVILGVVICQ